MIRHGDLVNMYWRRLHSGCGLAEQHASLRSTRRWRWRNNLAPKYRDLHYMPVKMQQTFFYHRQSPWNDRFTDHLCDGQTTSGGKSWVTDYNDGITLAVLPAGSSGRDRFACWNRNTFCNVDKSNYSSTNIKAFGWNGSSQAVGRTNNRFSPGLEWPIWLERDIGHGARVALLVGY